MFIGYIYDRCFLQEQLTLNLPTNDTTVKMMNGKMQTLKFKIHVELNTTQWIFNKALSTSS
jgi:hypothetical protein